MKKKIKQFLKYTVSGVSTFIIDLAILFILNDFFNINYLLSASIGFIIGITLNYIFSRNFAFKDTSRSFLHGYVYFLAIASIGLILINIFMYLLVDKANMDTVLSRILVAGVVGMWNFIMNSIFNFKEHKKPIK